MGRGHLRGGKYRFGRTIVNLDSSVPLAESVNALAYIAEIQYDRNIECLSTLGIVQHEQPSIKPNPDASGLNA